MSINNSNQPKITHLFTTTQFTLASQKNVKLKMCDIKNPMWKNWILAIKSHYSDLSLNLLYWIHYHNICVFDMIWFCVSRASLSNALNSITRQINSTISSVDSRTCFFYFQFESIFFSSFIQQPEWAGLKNTHCNRFCR